MLHENMRQSVCTEIIEDGADLATAKFLMRNADIRRTEKYWHANPKKYHDIFTNRGKIIQSKKAVKTGEK